MTVIGLDVTHKAGISPEIWSSMDQLPAFPGLEILKAPTDYFQKSYKDIYDIDEPPLPDVLTIAFLAKYQH